MGESGRPLRLLDYVEAIAASRRQLVRNHLVVMVTALTLSLLLPKWYVARSVIFPPEGGDGDVLEGVLSSPVARGFLSSLAIDGAPTSNMLLIGMLKSRAVALPVIDSLGLVPYYKAKNAEKAYLKFRKRLTVEETPEGFIEIRAGDRNPEMAARIANACADELTRLSVAHNRSRAHKATLFLAARLDSTRVALQASLDSLRRFQETTGTVEVSEQTKALISLAGELLAERTVSSVQLAAMRSYATERNPAIRELETRLSAIDRKLEELRVADVDGSPQNAFLSLGRLPADAMAYAQLLLDVKTQEEAYVLLTAQHEKTRIDEAREMTRIDVLDVAVPPIKKARPKRALLVIALLLSSFAFHAIYIAARLALEASPDAVRWERLLRGGRDVPVWPDS
jgi:capsule polysaccharide export protein KpsE/RkpR